jgi:hypothetical protein
MGCAGRKSEFEANAGGEIVGVHFAIMSEDGELSSFEETIGGIEDDFFVGVVGEANADAVCDGYVAFNARVSVSVSGELRIE